jgi:hypothetical protein
MGALLDALKDPGFLALAAAGFSRDPDAPERTMRSYMGTGEELRRAEEEAKKKAQQQATIQALQQYAQMMSGNQGLDTSIYADNPVIQQYANHLKNQQGQQYGALSKMLSPDVDISTVAPLFNRLGSTQDKLGELPLKVWEKQQELKARQEELKAKQERPGNKFALAQWVKEKGLENDPFYQKLLGQEERQWAPSEASLQLDYQKAVASGDVEKAKTIKATLDQMHSERIRIAKESRPPAQPKDTTFEQKMQLAENSFTEEFKRKPTLNEKLERYKKLFGAENLLGSLLGITGGEGGVLPNATPSTVKPTGAKPTPKEAAEELRRRQLKK